ncbi:MFS transporter [Rhizobium mongolense]|uniref:MFS family permease n=2 Tax=Rhizobium mongolense TaxID=57676 RepID=A0ABR6IYI9_9HYPH|nr:MFS transporter [Rhizobium mongolense]MBB4232519.1 MFS family permease [Rhizobium mongolense]TVZ75039.1 MFS transporter [Rhizobium mongolense USDA 1844]
MFSLGNKRSTRNTIAGACGTNSVSIIPRAGAIVFVLGFVQILSYGTLYYSVAIVSGDVAEDFSVPASWVYGAFSLALFIAALLPATAGRLMDTYGAGRLMGVASIAAAVSLAIAASSPSAALFLFGLIGMQISSVFLFYEAAFVFLAQFHAATARKHITQLTLIVGFSSAIFWPATEYLMQIMSWRWALAAYAIINLTVSAPVHFWLNRRSCAHLSDRAHSVSQAVENSTEGLKPDGHRLVMILVTLGFTLTTFIFSAILGLMVPMLGALGLGPAAVLISAVFGPAQVLVRIVAIGSIAKWNALVLTLISCVLVFAALAILAASYPLTLGAIGFAFVFGFASGLTSICRGTLPLALFGEAAYGARLGRISTVRLTIASVAPFILAISIERLGGVGAISFLLVTAALSIIAFLTVGFLMSSKRFVAQS